MEMLRKRRASSEVQSLMSDVLTDYEFFTNFDTNFENPSRKRQRNNNHTSYKSKSSSVIYHQVPGNKIWDIRENPPTKSDNVITRHVSRVPASISRDHWSKNQFETSFQSQKRQVMPKLTRIGLERSPETFYNSDGEMSPQTLSPPAARQTNSLGWEKTELIEIRELQRQSSQYEFQQAVNVHTQDDTVNILTNINNKTHPRQKTEVRRPSNVRFETVTQPAKSSTQIIYNSTTQQNLPYETAFLATREEKEKPNSLQKSFNQNKQITLAPRYPTKYYVTNPIKITENEAIIIEDDDVSSPVVANEESVYKSRQQFSPVERACSEKSVSPVQSPTKSSSSDEIISSPYMGLWPSYVITKVGSLLWLDKDRVYPITLGEIHRRVQDPENFSFQMLIAYVRHSRAKGRQFLNYWNCQPTGKISRPNVLSKLCEADARELVEGIREMNEEYFPTEKLAQNAAKNMLGKLNEEFKNPVEVHVKDNVERVEKSRSVLQSLEKALTISQEDEKFEMFNVASHNVGLANIKYSLKFLETILERVQNNIRRGQTNSTSSTGQPVVCYD